MIVQQLYFLSRPSAVLYLTTNTLTKIYKDCSLIIFGISCRAEPRSTWTCFVVDPVFFARACEGCSFIWAKYVLYYQHGDFVVTFLTDCQKHLERPRHILINRWHTTVDRWGPLVHEFMQPKLGIKKNTNSTKWLYIQTAELLFSMDNFHNFFIKLCHLLNSEIKSYLLKSTF